jgi:hypothetical protein
MKYIKRFSEDIKVPIELGDTILGGRFKNKKVVVKKIGKNKKGDITVNDKPLLKYRILKESISQEDINNQLAYLIDDGFQVVKDNWSSSYKIEIFKQKERGSNIATNNMTEIKWSDIESDLLPFIELNRDIIKEIILIFTTFSDSIYQTKQYDRKILSVDEILEDKNFGKILRLTILLK